MMESTSKAASEDRHSMHALESPVNKKPRWQGSLLLRQAPGVWDASERARSCERCSLCFSPEARSVPLSLPVSQEDTVLAEMPCQGVRSPLCCTCC